MSDPCQDSGYVVAAQSAEIGGLLSDMRRSVVKLYLIHRRTRRIMAIVEAVATGLEEDPETCRELRARLARLQLLLIMHAAALREQTRACVIMPDLAGWVLVGNGDIP